MKRIVCLIVVLIAVMPGLALAEEPVYFADANLKAAVEADLGISDPTPTDMLALTMLSASSQGIADLTGLEYAKNIGGLWLFDNQISDISALASLTNLKKLRLYGNQISDISALAGLTNLEWLWLGRNQISDTSMLADLTNLEVLDLGSNQIGDISVLAGLTKLTSLVLNGNQISNISVLSNLTNLTDLLLQVNQISDISALAGLTNLWRLHLALNQISDISALSGLTNLEVLYLLNNQISDISALASLTNLENLFLLNNQISDISALAGLTNLKWLNLDNNQISSISMLAGLTKLQGLYLNHNQISNISVLAELMNLLHFHLRGNPLGYDACETYIPQIRQNNPHIDIQHDPCILPRRIYVDDDGLNDPVPYDSAYSDPGENGTFEHPFDMIQEGIDAALDGEIVFVRQGTYWETIKFAGRNITVTGFAPDEPNAIGPYPVLNARYAGTAVTFCNEEGPDCLLEGFVITRGMGGIAGAITCLDSSPTISNCLIVGNQAMATDGGGGAVFCLGSDAVFENCTFSGNYGGPQGAGLSIYVSNVLLVNSILWDNYPQAYIALGSSLLITYSDIQGEWPGSGNMTEPPLFAAPGYWARIYAPDVQTEPFDPDAIWIDGDYHLLSEFGRYQPGQDEWVLDGVTSGCIDAGDPNTPVGEEPLPNGGIINTGAYGGTLQASMSLSTVNHLTK